MPGRSFARESGPAVPRVSRAVESASVSVAEGRAMAARTAPAIGAPVRGSRTWPKVRPSAWQDLPQIAEMERDSSLREMVVNGWRMGEGLCFSVRAGTGKLIEE